MGADFDMGKLYSARDHLDNAARAIAALETPKRTSDFTANFGNFLSSMRTFYAHLTQFSKQTNYLTNWFGQIKKENNEDELMYFFTQARNQTDHGGDIPLDFSWSVEMKPGGEGSVFTTRLGTAWDLSPDLHEENIACDFKLLGFQDARSKKNIPLPTSSFGADIGDDALEATRHVFERMATTFEAAWAIAHTPALHTK